MEYRYAKRVAALRKWMRESSFDALVLRNNPDLRWLTGAERVFDDEIAHVAFVTPEGLWLHTDSRYFGTFVNRLGTGGPWQLDQEVISPAEWVVRHIIESDVFAVGIEDSISLGFFDELQEELKHSGTDCTLPRMHDDIAAKLRVVKDDEELMLLREAQRITDDAFEHICTYIHAGMTELELRAELEGYMLTHGAEALSFASIVAAGPNGANPHAQPSDYVLKDGDMVVLDYGAAYHDYHADMTRTVCVGKPSDEARKVYDIVRQTNESCARAIHAGVIGRDIHELAVKLIGDAGYGEYFGHGLGHGVGIQIHEKPNFNRRSLDVIGAGSVITVEPGIYLPGKFGVRIEDCGLVDEQGYHPFSRISHELMCVG